MTAHVINTPTTYASLTTANGDTFTVNRSTTTGGELTITNEDTINIAGLTMTDGGKLTISSTNTTNPMIVKLGDTGAFTARIEGRSQIKATGEWISLGTSDGTASQTFTLPATVGSAALPMPPFVSVDNGGEETIYVCINAHHSHAAALTDVYGTEKMGKFFYYNSGSNQIEFGDGTDGYIPENLATIRIPNIFVYANNQNITLDLTTNGVFDFNKACVTRDGSSGYITTTGLDSSAKFSLVDSGFVSSNDDIDFNAGAGELTFTRSSVCVNGVSKVNFGNITGSLVATDCTFYQVDSGSTANEELIVHTNSSGATFTDCKILSRYEAVELSSVSNFTMTGCILAGSVNNLYLLSLASVTNSTFTNLELTGYPFQDTSATSIRFFLFSNGSGGNTFNGFKTINDHEAAFNNGGTCDLILISAGCNDNSIDGSRQTIDLGANDCAKFIEDYGNNNSVKGVKIEGDFTDKYIDQTSSSANGTYVDLRLESHSASTKDFEFSSGVSYELCSKQDSYDINFSVNAAKDCAFHSFYDRDNLARATLYTRMSEPLNDAYLTQTNGTGDHFFAADVRFYIETVGDKFQFESIPMRGITGIEADAVTITGATTGNFTVRFKMKTANIGSYGALRDFTQADLVTAFDELEESADEIRDRGIVIAYEIEKSGGTNFFDSYIRDLRWVATVEADYTPVDYIDVPFTNLPNTATDIVRVEELDSGGLPLSPNVYIDITGSGGTATANIKKSTKHRYKADAIGYYRSDDWINFDTTTITSIIVQLREIVDSNGAARYGSGTTAIKDLLAYDGGSDEMRITYDASYPNIDYDSALDKTEEILTSFAALDADLEQPNYQDGEIIFTSTSTVELADAPGNAGTPNLEFAAYRAGQANSNSLVKSPWHTTYGLHTKDTNINTTDAGNIKSVKGVAVTDVTDFHANVSALALEATVAALNDISTSDLDTALSSYDGPTKAEMDAGLAALNNLSTADIDARLTAYGMPTLIELTSAFTEIKGAGWVSTDNLQTIKSSFAALGTAAELDLVKIQSTLARKHLTNRDKIDSVAKTLTRYDDDATTPLVVFDLKDGDGVASTDEIFEKDPQ